MTARTNVNSLSFCHTLLTISGKIIQRRFAHVKFSISVCKRNSLIEYYDKKKFISKMSSFH